MRRAGVLTVGFAVAVVTLAAVIGRDSGTVAVPTAGKAVALAEAYLAPRVEGVTVERSQATLARSAEEFKAATTLGLGPNGYERPVWVVTLGATWPGQTNRIALRYVIEAETGRFLVLSFPLPGRTSAIG